MKRLAVVAGLLLAGCVTPEQLAQKEHAECLSYGFEMGTDGYSECRMELGRMRAIADAERKAAMMALGAQLMADDPEPAVQWQGPHPVKCQVIPVGKINHINCR